MQIKTQFSRSGQIPLFKQPQNIAARIKYTSKKSQTILCTASKDEEIASLSFEQPSPSSSPNVCCFGCGIRLQAANTAAPGYVELDKFELKKRHRQLNQLLCVRCQELSNGAMLPGVADFAQRRETPTTPPPTKTATGSFITPSGRILLNPEQLRSQLASVRDQAAVVVLLVDLLDSSGSFLTSVRDLVGRNPIILIGTKADLLPSGTNTDEIASWLRDLAAFKRVNVVDVHVISSKSGEGVSSAVAGIRKERKGRDVYILGAANVGKSAFIRALVKDMSKTTSRQYDPMAAAKKKLLPTESPMPGTTLGTIPLNVFSAGGILYDTPGLHLHHRVPHMLTPEENKKLHPRKKLKAYVPPSPLQLITEATAEDDGGDEEEGVDDNDMDIIQQQNQEQQGNDVVVEQQGEEEEAVGEYVASYSWGGIARFDILGGPEDLHLVFYGTPAMRVDADLTLLSTSTATPITTASTEATNDMDTEQQEKHQQSEQQQQQQLLEEDIKFGSESVSLRGGLRIAKTLSIPRMGYGECIADIAVSGVPGWVSVYSQELKRGKAVEVNVWAPVGVEVFLRPPMPVPTPFY